MRRHERHFNLAGVRRLLLMIIKNSGMKLSDVRLFVLDMRQAGMRLRDNPDLRKSIIRSGLSYVIHRKRLWLAPLTQSDWDKRKVADIISEIVSAPRTLEYLDEKHIRNPFRFVGHRPFMTMLNRGLEYVLGKKVDHLGTKLTENRNEADPTRRLFVSRTSVFEIDRVDGNVLLCSGIFLKFIRLGACDVGLSVLPSATVRLPNLEVASGRRYNPFLHYSHKKLYGHIWKWMSRILPLTITISNKTLIFEVNNLLDVREAVEGQRRLDEWI